MHEKYLKTINRQLLVKAKKKKAKKCSVFKKWERVHFKERKKFFEVRFSFNTTKSYSLNAEEAQYLWDKRIRYNNWSMPCSH